MIQLDELLKDLTEPQREAVTYVDGPLLIVAGAGSGKTRVITRRVGYLMSLGIPANSILAITFTNKAAGEMKARVSAISPRALRDFGKLDQPWPMICTFHSLCLRILRHYARTVGLPGNFSIYDAADQGRVIKEAMKALDLSTTNFTPGQVHGTISNAKNQLLTAQAYAERGGDFYQKTVARVYTKYEELLRQNNALDFDDLLLRTAHAFRDHPPVLKELQERFQYILIDEYQDTNHAQYVIAHALALRHRNICVVGDPDQSIYAWRGANIKNILEFERDYPDAKVVRLEQNYRSTKTILQIASRVIANNTQRKEKSLWTENEYGDRATLLLCQDEYDEAEAVTRQLETLHEKLEIDWNQMAIFYRMNALSRVMEDKLRAAKIPYQIARGVEFYNRKEIKDVLAYLRVVANPKDEVSLGRVVNVPPRGIGDKAVSLLEAHARGKGRNAGLFGAMEAAGEVGGLSTRAVASIGRFVGQVKRWRAIAGEGSPVRDLMETVVEESGLEDLLAKDKDADERGESPMANVNELITSAAEYDAEHSAEEGGSLEGYLAMVSLVSDVDHLKDAGGAVTLMTLHAAKGLEFPVVAMIGMEEGILPHARAKESRDGMEEERRLCFVGITRTQRHLVLSKAARRRVRGMWIPTVTSPFLREMPQERLEVVDRTGISFGGSRSEERERLEREADELASQFRRGQLVRHPVFGLGRIADISDMGQQTRAVVEFNAAGRKTLILQYTKLEAVG